MPQTPTSRLTVLEIAHHFGLDRQRLHRRRLGRARRDGRLLA